MPGVEYRTDASDLDPAWLKGFFQGWPEPPSPATHLEILRRSYRTVLAIDPAGARVAGFITAVSDGVLAAYIPLLEVHADYRRRGIGHELVRRVLDALDGLYMIDLVCDAELEPFYAGLGFVRGHAMLARNYAAQSGRAGVRP